VITSAPLERDLVILACAISAGIHAALVPHHLADGGAAATGFGAAAVLLAVVAVALTRRVGSAALIAAASLTAGLIASYGLAVTTGVPLLHPDPEPIDGLAIFTKAVELVALAAAAHLLGRRRQHVARAFVRPKGSPA
jgi:hypothetical protein